MYRWPCSEDYTQISSAVVFAKNLQLAPSSVSRDVRSLLNLAGIYLADIKHSDAIYSEITCRPCQLTPEITAMYVHG